MDNKTVIPTKREDVKSPALGMLAFHDKIYNGKELMKVVGIRETEVELEGDYSGGTNNVTQKDWLPIKGLFRLRKICDEYIQHGTCTRHNIHCAYPDCEPYVTTPEFYTPSPNE